MYQPCGAMRLAGPYTVFAPTDSAFAALGKSTLDAPSSAEVELVPVWG